MAPVGGPGVTGGGSATWVQQQRPSRPHNMASRGQDDRQPPVSQGSQSPPQQLSQLPPQPPPPPQHLPQKLSQGSHSPPHDPQPPQPWPPAGIQVVGRERQPARPASSTIATRVESTRFMSYGSLLQVLACRCWAGQRNLPCYGPLQRTSVRQPAESRKSSEPLFSTRLVRPDARELGSRAIK